MVEKVSQKVFIVHGHDEVAKIATARFVQRLDLEAVILDEQPSEGLTIIEKFERYARNANFAIVLMTPDDVGAPIQKKNDLKLRARQNVIFELGYFFHALGRKGVCALYKEGVELPSDIYGVVYVLMDELGAWQLKLAREMKQAGLSFDANKLL
ncbi:MAG: nucleotide-binding protein [Candidatus Poribacteria bacterium]|nr:nucleotide-binding protein [Candidatus Poribacteria bacterium]